MPDMQVECTVKGAVAGSATAQILLDPDWNACDSFDNPDRIVPRPKNVRVNGPRIQLDLPPLSVATAIGPLLEVLDFRPGGRPGGTFQRSDPFLLQNFLQRPASVLNMLT
jgi:hypothetical protein